MVSPSNTENLLTIGKSNSTSSVTYDVSSYTQKRMIPTETDKEKRDRVSLQINRENRYQFNEAKPNVINIITRKR